MIIAYDENGKKVGRYDSASDLWDDYQDAIVRGNVARV